MCGSMDRMILPADRTAVAVGDVLRTRGVDVVDCSVDRELRTVVACTAACSFRRRSVNATRGNSGVETASEASITLTDSGDSSIVAHLRRTDAYFECAGAAAARSGSPTADTRLRADHVD